jgi:hypothetical protein
MKTILVATMLAGLTACGNGRNGEVASHVPLTIAGVTYQWPTDSTTDFDDLGRPERWRSVAYILIGIWNEVMSPILGFPQQAQMDR